MIGVVADLIVELVLHGGIGLMALAGVATGGTGWCGFGWYSDHDSSSSGGWLVWVLGLVWRLEDGKVWWL